MKNVLNGLLFAIIIIVVVLALYAAPLPPKDFEVCDHIDRYNSTTKDIEYCIYKKLESCDKK